MTAENVLNAIPTKTVFHSALLSTYSIDFHFMEQRLMSMLRSRGIRNIAVIADARMVEDCIETTGGHIKKASELYTVSTVLCNGAFHPKIHIYTGDNAALLLIGSGNITSGGMGKNQEVFTHVYADNNSNEYLPIIIQAWLYMKNVCTQFKGITRVQIDWMEQHCSLLRDTSTVSAEGIIELPNGIGAAFVGNNQYPLWQTIVDLLPDTAEVSRVTIASPYFDEEGALIKAIRSKYLKTCIDVLLQPSEALLPIKYKGDNLVKFYDWNDTQAHRENTFSKGRFLHGKLLHFQSTNMEVLITGSANATSRAFLEGSVSNMEAVLVLQGKEMKWLQQLGVYGYSQPIDIKALKQTFRHIEDEGIQRVSFIHKIDNIDKTRSLLKVYLSDPLPYIIELVMVDHARKIAATSLLQPGNSAYTVSDISEDIIKSLLYAYLRDKNGVQISNSQLVNNSEAIWNTNPSPENRRVLNLLNKISSAEYSELDLFEYYDAIHSETDVEERKNKTSARTEIIENTQEANTTTEEAKKLLEEHEVIPIDEYEVAPKFLTAYIDRLREEISRMNDEDTDDEEDGDISTGVGRQQKSAKELVFNSQKIFQKAKDRISRVFRIYTQQMRKRVEQNKAVEYSITQSDHAIFLLCLSHLLAISGKEQKYMIGKEEHKGVLMPVNGAINDFSSFHSIAFNVIGSFIALLKAAKSEKQYIHEYDRVRLKYFKELSLGKILTSLALLKSKTTGFGDREEKWKKLILINVAEVYTPQPLNIRSIILKQAEVFNIVVEDVTDEIIYIDDLYSNVLQVYSKVKQQNLLQNIHLHKIVYLDEVGFCYVEDCLPSQLAPKSLKLSNLGFEYDLVDFVGGKVYNISKNRFYQLRPDRYN